MLIVMVYERGLTTGLGENRKFIIVVTISALWEEPPARLSGTRPISLLGFLDVG